MMKQMETGEDKIQKICDALRKETILPAQEEAQRIVDKAKEQAEQIKKQAKEEAEEILADAKKQIEQENNIFQSSMNQAMKQSLETLKQNIETHLFNKQLGQIVDQALSDPKVIADLINAIVKGIEKEGISSDISVEISKNMSPKEISKYLLSDVIKKLKEKPFELDDFAAGVKVKLTNKKMSLEMTDEVLRRMLTQFLRKDFREMLFNHQAV